MPKLPPQVIKSTEVVQENGGARSIKQINFAEGKIVITVQKLY